MKASRNRRLLSADVSPHAGEGTGESWDHVASWYDSLVANEGTQLYQQVIIPGVLRLLNLQKPERVLDLACGQGVITRALHHAGARVTGVDLSPRLIEMARQRSTKSISYAVGDARHLDLPDAHFEAIVSVLALQNIDHVEAVFSECARLLRPWGRLVAVISHPAFRIPRQSNWRWDEERKLLFRAVDRYLTPLKIPIDSQPFRNPSLKSTWTYHSPIQTYVNGLASAGLWTSALEEWPSPKVSQAGPKARAENRARAEFPLFLALQAVRVPPEAQALEP